MLLKFLKSIFNGDEVGGLLEKDYTFGEFDKVLDKGGYSIRDLNEFIANTKDRIKIQSKKETVSDEYFCSEQDFMAKLRVDINTAEEELAHMIGVSASGDDYEIEEEGHSGELQHTATPKDRGDMSGINLH